MMAEREKMAMKRLQRSLRVLTSVIVASSVFIGCNSGAVGLDAVEYAPLPGDGWEVSTPEERGLDPTRVAELYHNAAELERLFGLLVVKDGYLIAEDYFNEGSIDQEARIQSATKSVASALVGIALDRGCLDSVDQKMIDFFPEVADQVTDPRKREITIRQMLQMRAGYPSEESNAALWEGLLSGHYPPFIKDFPLIADPGTEFHYSNLTSNWLGIIVDRACGMHLKPYAEAHLFSPMSIEAGEWGTDWEGHNNASGDLHLTARDMARFGLLYLDDGQYEGNQIVPSGWVQDSLQTYSAGARGNIGRFRDIGYGYHWWSARAGDHRVNFAWGHGGQLIALVDDLDMVVVVTADPFYLVNTSESWKHEKAHIQLAAKFISSLPGE